MFIFYQKRSIANKSEHFLAIACPLCGKTGGIEITVHQKYYWLFHPIFPSVKYGRAGCTACDQILPVQKWTDEVEKNYLKLKKAVKTPRKLWVGLLLLPLYFVLVVGIAILAGNLVSNYFKNTKAEEIAIFNTFLYDPKPGDVYRVWEFSSSRKNYVCTFLKFDHLVGDTIFMRKSRHAAPGIHSWDMLPLESENSFETKLLPMDYNNFKENRVIAPIGGDHIEIFLQAIERNKEIYEPY